MLDLLNILLLIGTNCSPLLSDMFLYLYEAEFLQYLLSPVVACRQGTLTPPDTWSHPFGTCIWSTFWDRSFFRTCHYFSGLCSSNIPRYFLDLPLIKETTSQMCTSGFKMKIDYFTSFWNLKVEKAKNLVLSFFFYPISVIWLKWQFPP